ncbi:hypothetical protein P170DRAFT_430364 [Aspergillus steynii IBT 23096]|uniref:Uncharacterized protein n=1 Tax=Aspergillus steynii IBT 23096 TaxID=1392250 RepID=A0A2I2FV24_9EURO|nr:uncharacterized protein P170DRAFT_430364 [Aspergillus steynii IBT 23096]PLB44474.1 hypothetical protein P170DRAFT_430364 [Aspergillus steynii IBT 23096]
MPFTIEQSDVGNIGGDCSRRNRPSADHQSGGSNSFLPTHDADHDNVASEVTVHIAIVPQATINQVDEEASLPSNNTDDTDHDDVAFEADPFIRERPSFPELFFRVIFEIDRFRETFLPSLSPRERATFSLICRNIREWVEDHTIVYRSKDQPLYRQKHFMDGNTLKGRLKPHKPTKDDPSPVAFTWEGGGFDPKNVQNQIKCFISDLKAMLIPSLAPRERARFSLSCRKTRECVEDNTIVYPSKDQSLYRQTHFIDGNTLKGRLKPNKPTKNDPSPGVFTWECGSFDPRNVQDQIKCFISGAKAMLQSWNSIRAIELYKAHFLRPNWIQEGTGNNALIPFVGSFEIRSESDTDSETSDERNAEATAEISTKEYREHCYSKVISIPEGQPQNVNSPGHKYLFFRCDYYSGRFTGYCFPNTHIHSQKQYRRCGGCSREDVMRTHLRQFEETYNGEAMTMVSEALHNAIQKWLSSQTFNWKAKYTEKVFGIAASPVANSKTQRTTYTYEQSPSLRFIIGKMSGQDPQVELAKILQVKTREQPVIVGEATIELSAQEELANPRQVKTRKQPAIVGGAIIELSGPPNKEKLHRAAVTFDTVSQLQSEVASRVRRLMPLLSTFPASSSMPAASSSSANLSAAMISPAVGFMTVGGSTTHAPGHYDENTLKTVS